MEHSLPEIIIMIVITLNLLRVTLNSYNLMDLWPSNSNKLKVNIVNKHKQCLRTLAGRRWIGWLYTKGSVEFGATKTKSSE